MKVVEEHVSPDGRLRFLVVDGSDSERTLGFAWFQWHTHPSILAFETGLPEADAVRKFIDDLIGGVSVIVLWSVNGELRDVWVSEDPQKDAGYAKSKYAEPGESVELRYWDGRLWEG